MREILLDGGAVTSRAELHDLLSRSLDLPEWYGRNLDALYDCLTDLVNETQIFLLGMDPMRDVLGPYADSLLQVLHDAAAENKNLSLTVLPAELPTEDLRLTELSPEADMTR